MFQMLWRNKFHIRGYTMDELIESMEEAARLFRRMRARGVTFPGSSGPQDDYYFLSTDDPEVAEEFGFWEVDEDGLPIGDEDPDEVAEVAAACPESVTTPPEAGR